MEQKETPDIFDRLMHLPVLRILEPFYRKNKEVLLYLFFGGLTTVVSLGTFWLFYSALGWNEHAANVLSWLLAVLFAFLTNRTWVFSATAQTGFFRQMVNFYAGRLVTLGVEELLLFIFITCLHGNALAVKLAAQVVVIVLNYVVSKLWVFRKKK